MLLSFDNLKADGIPSGVAALVLRKIPSITLHFSASIPQSRMKKEMKKSKTERIFIHLIRMQDKLALVLPEMGWG